MSCILITIVLDAFVKDSVFQIQKLYHAKDVRILMWDGCYRFVVLVEK